MLFQFLMYKFYENKVLTNLVFEKSFLVLTEHDWDLQHKLFHELFKESHPIKRKLKSESSELFSWPRYNGFTGKYDHTKFADDGRNLVAAISPFNLCKFPQNNPLHHPFSPETVD